MEKITSKEIMQITGDFIPSIIAVNYKILIA